MPWPQILLGLAAALAILVVYDVCYVWPLCRRLAATNERCRVLEEAVGEAVAIAARLDDLDARSREHWTQVAERLGQLELSTDSRSYEQAIDFAEQGEAADRLIACFGLTEGEADLVRLIHGADAAAAQTKGDRRASARRSRRSGGSRAA